MRFDINAAFPKKLGFLIFKNAAYKVAHGGRGAAKSWGFARALLLRGMKKKERILCVREVQNSIAESVHKLLSEQIEKMGLQEFYTVKKTTIVGANGTEFIFSGIHRNIRKVKSKEGITICWAEEADSISKAAWDILIPTIREEGSELWISFNPNLASDDTFKRFVLDPPKDSIVVQMNWRDNPWFTDKMNDDRVEMKRKDPDGYLNVWEGKCRHAVEGAIFANELRDATLGKNGVSRIMRVPYNPTVPVHTFWDLGWSDMVAIWLAQKVGFEYHVIGYMEDAQKTVAHFVKELDKLDYVYGTYHLPHDGNNKLLAANGASVKKLLQAAKPSGTIRVLPNVSLTSQINYARTVFPLCYFDEKNCEQGLERLRRYKYDIDEETRQRKKLPTHDDNSHGASAFMGFAISIKHVDKKKRPEEKQEQGSSAHPEFGEFVPGNTPSLAWMG